MLCLFPTLALVLSLGLAGPGTVSAAPLITVETAPGDDAAIIDGVKRTHAPDPHTKLFEVTAETSGGITVLNPPKRSPTCAPPTTFRSAPSTYA